jgi:hypothetical protein
MPAALAITPTSGNITAAKSACRIDVTGAETNRAPDETGGPYEYLIKASCTGVDDLVSYVFNVSSDGKHSFQDLLFPVAGSWTVDLIDTDGDSVVATLAVTVS